MGGNGELKASLVPQESAPKPGPHEVPCAPVWKRYYTSVELKTAADCGLNLGPRNDNHLKPGVGRLCATIRKHNATSRASYRRLMMETRDAVLGFSICRAKQAG